MMDYGYRLEGRQRIRLKDCDPAAVAGLKKGRAKKETARLIAELMELQELLYAVRQQSVLIVLQGRDSSGKDGTIYHVAGPLDSRSCTVAYFKAPTEEERAHDFLWRIHAQTPSAGHIRLFNRSHYERVLVERVHHLIPQQAWRAAYGHINAFEQLLADANTIILKFYLHISPEEQERRLLKREQDPLKYWKIDARDWQEREHWDDYTVAYEEALHRCSHPWAPWIIVPADQKWFRNLVVAQALRNALQPFREQWVAALDEMGKKKKKEMADYRRQQNQGDGRAGKKPLARGQQGADRSKPSRENLP
jgi:PPK2 family polyphosphate:nucleotide phosphotransferase